MVLYTLIILIVTIIWLALLLYARRRQRHVRDLPPMNGAWPSISVIVPAMNEEETIEPAMRSLLMLDYPDIEIIAVNDRSTDRTGEILDRLATEHPGNLRVIHVTDLPAGWLGKCNALSVAARHARGEWILFTDADVIFEPDALRVAAAFATSGRADHIVLFPRMLWGDPVEAALLAFFAMALTIGFRMWRVESRSLRAFVGIGAFNMIRRELYEGFGGHAPLRLEVADDMKLGYLAKKHGGRSMAVLSGGKVRVRWRMGTIDTIRGLERSGFAGIDFNWPKTISAILLCAVLMLGQYVLLIIPAAPVVHLLALASILLIIVIYATESRSGGFPWWAGILHPVACVLFIYAFARSAIVTSIRGGLSWRGTFYSIAELRRGTVR
ncbi:MAG: glycosyltransferase family 2 protein [Candidatus Kapaibacterium sp.]